MRSRSALALVLVLVFAPLPGCVTLDFDLSRGSWGGGGSGLNSFGRLDRDDISSNVIYLTSGERKELLLLVEGSASGGIHSGNPAGGELRNPSGRMVEWHCPARRGKLTELQIDGQVFPLESGRVFHIDVRDDRTRVRQLDLDPHEVASGSGSIRENVRAFAPKNAAIAEFCNRCNPAD